MKKRLEFNLFRQAALWATFIAASALLNTLNIPFFMGGTLAMRIRFDGALLAFVAAACGPVYGALAYMESDVLGYLLNPGGEYLYQITLIAAFKGAAIGLMWRAAKRMRARRVGLICGWAFLLIALAGAFSAIAASPGGAMNAWQTTLGGSADYISAGLIFGGCAGVAGSALAYSLRDRYPALTKAYCRALFAVVVPGVLAAAMNTLYIARYAGITGNALTTLLAPHIGMEVLFSTLNAYMVTALYALFQRVFVEPTGKRA